MSHNPNIQKRPYRLSAYSDEWPKQFAVYAKKIKKILGTDLLEIHHFGSTSIPGMVAKPNIDIYALVTSLHNIRALADQMEGAGFIPRGDYSNIGEEYFTCDNEDGERVASIHIFEGNNEVFREYRDLRDYLIAHDDAKRRYIDLKKQLYRKHPNDYPAYDQGKAALIKELKASAKNWAAERAQSSKQLSK